jgi:hypothetical protein
MEAAIRIQNWLVTLQLLAMSRQVSLGSLDFLWPQFSTHAHFIQRKRSRYSSANNHLIVEAAAAAILGAEFPGLEKAALQVSLETLVTELPKQVHIDGCSAEQAFGYHRLVLEQLLILTLYVEDLPDCILQTMRRMTTFLADLVADAELPLVGDSDDSRILRLTPLGMSASALVDLASVLLGDTPPGARPLDANGFWLTAQAGRQSGRSEATGSARVPPTIRLTTTHYPAGGYTMMRTPDGRSRMLFDHGPLGLGPLAAHGHADCLSVELWRDGAPVLIDSGSYLYSVRAHRDALRSTDAHNTVEIGGRDQSEILGPFLWGHRANAIVFGTMFSDGVDIVQAAHTGYAPQSHERSVARIGNELFVISDVIGSPHPTEARASFHFAKGLPVTLTGNTLRIRDGCAGILVTPEGATLSLGSIVTAPAFLSLAATTVLGIQFRFVSTTSLHTIVCFDTLPAVHMAGGWLGLELADSQVRIAFGSADDGRFRFQGQSAYLMLRNGEPDWVIGRGVNILETPQRDLSRMVQSLRGPSIA